MKKSSPTRPPAAEPTPACDSASETERGEGAALEPSPRIFRFTQEPQGLLVSFEARLREDAVLRMRRVELCRNLVRVFRLIGPARATADHTAIRITCDARDGNLMHAHWKAAEERTERIASRPCTPRETLELLGISRKERLRWTKDGQLATSGRVPLRRNDGTGCDTYPPELLITLVKQPEIIAGWRRQDAGR